MANEQMGRDLVLPPNTFAFALDTTKGRVAVSVGPTKVSFSNTESPVVWDPVQKRFLERQDSREVIQVFSLAAEGQYIVLQNPADDPNLHPSKGTSSDAKELNVGRKVNIPGPVSFALWPGQAAQTIDGHHLRHNQYLLVRVYDDQEARKNWRSAVVKPQVALPTVPSSEEGTSRSDVDQAPPAPKLEVLTNVDEAPELTMGQLMVIKGTSVSFYIPPTGIEVVPETGSKFVREAVTLERLEYCILLDENGEKSYRQGPDVVFPKPTEKFIESREGHRKFRSIELSEISGLYIKVIAPYEEGGRKYEAGDELFITGAEQAIYFPRPEHSIVEYDGKQIHYAIAVPAGEGRYVLDRKKGTVDLVRGPKMFLPDPRTQVVVRRILDPHTVQLLYPNNQEALTVNERYRAQSSDLSPGEHLTSAEAVRSASFMSSRRGLVADASEEYAGEAFRRGSTYAPPRSIVLDTKYEGAVAVNIWPGYAVLVTKKTGERRVELGPKMVLLEYDEILMPLELSTGRPKNDTKLFRTAYLRVANNQVGDIVRAETRDLVEVTIEVSYRVNFELNEGGPERWFNVENYVKVLTDHARSRIANAVRRQGIQEFYTNPIDIVRNAILGEQVEGKRLGLPFEENGMRVYDVEVLDVSIKDDSVAGLLTDAQSEALSGAIQLSAAEEKATRTMRLEALKRSEIDEREKTALKEAQVAKEKIGRDLEQRLAQAEADLRVTIEGQKKSDAELETERKAEEQEIDLARKRAQQEMERMKAETEEYTKRFGTFNNPDMLAALQMLNDKAFVEKVVTAMGPAAMAAGTTVAELFSQLFKDTPLEGTMKTLAMRPAQAERLPRTAS